MKQRILGALGDSRAGYTEVRVRRVWSTTVLVRGRTVEAAGTSLETGGAVRCCSPDTGWGLVGFSDTERFDGYVRQAHQLALDGTSRVPVRLAPIPIQTIEGMETVAEDPREVSLGEKRQRGESLSALIYAEDRRIAGNRVVCRDEVVETWLATSEGTWLHDLSAAVRIAVLAIAEEDGGVERSLGSLAVRGGWQLGTEPEELARLVARRAVDRLHATPVKAGHYSVVLDPAAAGALMHRAVGHLARPALPGADPDVLPMGTRIGPDFLTVEDDPTAEGLRPGWPADDEGVVPRRTTLIQNGVVVGHLHSRETAAAIGHGPTGHARAGTLRGAPHPRAANTYLAPGKGTPEELMSGVRLGLYISDVLACEGTGDHLAVSAGSARVIRDGEFAEAVKGVRIGGGLLSMLGRVDAVGGDFRWDGSDVRCRDGGAGVVPVTTGAPHLRLVDVAVGAGIS